jgi:hypothetical protein
MGTEAGSSPEVLAIATPNADRAVIDPRKLHGYLLSRSHQVGRFKAEFFLGLGYSPEDWRRLEADLRSQHLPKDATAEERTSYGQSTPSALRWWGQRGGRVVVASIWFVRRGDFPRFVTAYPEGSR